MNKTLSLSEAKKIASDIFSKADLIDRGEFLLVHSEKVGQVAKRKNLSASG